MSRRARHAQVHPDSVPCCGICILVRSQAGKAAVSACGAACDTEDTAAAGADAAGGDDSAPEVDDNTCAGAGLGAGTARTGVLGAGLGAPEAGVGKVLQLCTCVELSQCALTAVVVAVAAAAGTAVHTCEATPEELG